MILSVKGHQRLNGAISGRQCTEPNSGDYISENLGFHWTSNGGEDLGVKYLLGKCASLWTFRTFMCAGPKIILEDNTLSLFPDRETSQVMIRKMLEMRKMRKPKRKKFLSHSCSCSVVHYSSSWPLSNASFTTNSLSIFFYAHSTIEIVQLERSNCCASMSLAVGDTQNK